VARPRSAHWVGGGRESARSADLTASVDLTVFERCDRRHKSAVGQPSYLEQRTGSEAGRPIKAGNWVWGIIGLAMRARRWALAAWADVVADEV
jgi:hypothetical protein